MSAAQSDQSLFPIRSGVPAQAIGRIRATLTTAGAVATDSTTTSSDVGITLTKTGTTGAYALTYPASPGVVQIIVDIISPLGTIGQYYQSAHSSSAGTATLLFSAPNGTAAYGASGDIIKIAILGDENPVGQ